MDSDLLFSQEAGHRQLTFPRCLSGLSRCSGFRLSEGVACPAPIHSKARDPATAIERRDLPGKELGAGPGATLERWARAERPGIPCDGIRSNR